MRRDDFLKALNECGVGTDIVCFMDEWLFGSPEREGVMISAGRDCRRRPNGTPSGTMKPPTSAPSRRETLINCERPGVSHTGSFINGENRDTLSFAARPLAAGAPGAEQSCKRFSKEITEEEELHGPCAPAGGWG